MKRCVHQKLDTNRKNKSGCWLLIYLKFSMYFIPFFDRLFKNIIVFRCFNMIWCSILNFGHKAWKTFCTNHELICLRDFKIWLYFSQTGQIDSLNQKTFFKKTELRLVSDLNIPYIYFSDFKDFTILWLSLVWSIYKKRNSKKKQSKIPSIFDKSFKLLT